MSIGFHGKAAQQPDMNAGIAHLTKILRSICAAISPPLHLAVKMNRIGTADTLSAKSPRQENVGDITMNTKRATDNIIHADIGSAFSTLRRTLGGCVHTVKKWRDEHRHTQALSRLDAHLLNDIGEEAPPSFRSFNAQSVNSPLALSDEISFRLRH